jgi:N6-L-threonylcarbamoyladenine synthase
VEEIVLGFDSSCYTTSVAAVSLAGEIVADWRRLLAVEPGTAGLRQQEALFQHWQNFPQLLQQMRSLPHSRPVAIAYSERPTARPDSYLPVFTAASSLAQSIAGVMGIPSLPFTHQEGHLAAGRLGAGGPSAGAFLAVHMSGGTTELLAVQEKADGFEFSVLGKTLDLNAGQFVDRVGVALGLRFPAGPDLEKLALTDPTADELVVPSHTKGYQVSFSGPTTAALRLVSNDANKAAIARAVFRCIANSMEKILRLAITELGIGDVLLVGGVAANKIIRERLRDRLEHQAVGGKLFFAPPKLSTDNAVGIAWLGLSTLRRGKP